MIFSIIARIAGFIRDLLIAKYAGVGMMSDVFFASFKITNFFRKILAEGTFFAAFVPSFAKILKEKGKTELSTFASAVFSIMFYILLLITLIFEIFMEEISAFTAPGFLSDTVKFNLMVEISRILFWYFILIVMSSCLCGLLNSIKKFSYYAVFPVFLNLSLIVVILFFKDNFKTFAHALSCGVLIGGVLQMGFTYFGCIKEGFKLRLRLSIKSLFGSEVIKTFKRMIPAMIAGGLSQINTLIDLILGSLIVSGVSYLYYVDRIFYLPTASIGTAIGIVVLPILSSSIMEKNKKDISAIQTESINLSSLLVLPVTFSLILCADIFVSIVFERGSFTHKDVNVVANCLKILGFALPFVVYGKIFTSIFFSNDDTKTPMYISLFCVLLNTLVSIFLMKVIGIYGIIIGSMFSYMANTAITFYILKAKNLIQLNWQEVILFNVKILFASAVFGLFCFFFFKYYDSTKYFLNLMQYNIFYKLAYIILIAGFGMIIYYLMLIILKIDPKKLIKG